MLKLDTLVEVRDGVHERELAVVTGAKKAVREGRFGVKEISTITEYTAVFWNGEKFTFRSLDINKTVFVVE